MDVAGVLLYTTSCLAAVFYVLGTPLLVNYLIQLTRAQLYECEWWTNYETAWRRFNVVCVECEAWSIVQVVLAVGEVWKEQAVQDFVEYRRKGPAFVKWALGWTFYVIYLVACCPFRCVLKLCCSIDPDKERKKRKYQAMISDALDGPSRVARVLKSTGAYVFEQEKEDDVSTLGGDYVDPFAEEARGLPAEGFVLCRLYCHFHI